VPYDIVKREDGYHVINTRTGEDKGVSKTRAKAEAHMRALYAAENRKSESTPGMRFGGSMMLDDTYTPRPIEHVYIDGHRMPVMTDEMMAAMTVPVKGRARKTKKPGR
jgi:hypothetical protein